MGFLSTLFASAGTGIIGNWPANGANYYDALKNRGRRKRAVPSRHRSQDAKLTDIDRADMTIRVAQAVDNFAIAAWMVRAHVNYVAAINFRATTDNEEFNDELEAFMTRWSSRFRCHAQRKHCFRDLLRIMEWLRVADGDCFIYKIGGTSFLRGSVQIIEGDRVRTPDLTRFEQGQLIRRKLDGYVNGVKVTSKGIAQSYAVHTRGGDDGALVYEEDVDAQNMVHHGFFTRADQIRGVSPLVQALNTMQDVYEGFDYSLGKMKLAQLFGAFITREANYGLGGVPTRDSDGDGFPDRDYEIELSDGPAIVDLNPGEDVKIVQDATNLQNQVPFMEMMTQVCLKALDLPYSFYREDFSNWFGSRAARNHFETAARPKRAQTIDTANEITRWAVGMALIDGEITLPSGMEFDDITWEWVPEGWGWYDPVAQVTAFRAAIASGFDSIDRVCKEIGTDPVENLRSRAKYEKLARELELNGGLDFSMGSSSSVQLQKDEQGNTTPAGDGNEDPPADDEEETDEDGDSTESE